jgi:hypothetical protein
MLGFLWRRPPPRLPHNRYWASRIPEMRMEESMDNVERAIGQMSRGDFVERPHPRDLDRGRPPLQIPETPDLFADGLEIAQAVLDWEQRAGQEIAPLIAHIRKAQELRESVVSKASGSAGTAEHEVGT